MMTALCAEVWFGWSKLVASCSFFPITFCANSPLSFKAAEERLHIISIFSDLFVSLQVPLRIACNLNVGRQALSVLLCFKSVKDFITLYSLFS